MTLPRWHVSSSVFCRRQVPQLWMSLKSTYGAHKPHLVRSPVLIVVFLPRVFVLAEFISPKLQIAGVVEWNLLPSFSSLSIRVNKRSVCDTFSLLDTHPHVQSLALHNMLLYVVNCNDPNTQMTLSTETRECRVGLTKSRVNISLLYRHRYYNVLSMNHNHRDQTHHHHHRQVLAGLPKMIKARYGDMCGVWCLRIISGLAWTGGGWLGWTFDEWACLPRNIYTLHTIW